MAVMYFSVCGCRHSKVVSSDILPWFISARKASANVFSSSSSMITKWMRNPGRGVASQFTATASSADLRRRPPSASESTDLSVSATSMTMTRQPVKNACCGQMSLLTKRRGFKSTLPASCTQHMHTCTRYLSRLLSRDTNQWRRFSGAWR